MLLSRAFPFWVASPVGCLASLCQVVWQHVEWMRLCYSQFHSSVICIENVLYKHTHTQYDTHIPPIQGSKSSTLGRTTRPVSSSGLRSVSLTQPPSPAVQSKLDRLIKKLLKAGSDGDLGMVKFLLHWNNPAKDNSNGDTPSSSVAVTTVVCHPLCECDDCIKKVSSAC